MPVCGCHLLSACIGTQETVWRRVVGWRGARDRRVGLGARGALWQIGKGIVGLLALSEHLFVTSVLFRSENSQLVRRTQSPSEAVAKCDLTETDT